MLLFSHAIRLGNAGSIVRMPQPFCSEVQDHMQKVCHAAREKSGGDAECGELLADLPIGQGEAYLRLKRVSCLP